jgi:hypothetical protein
VAGGPARRDDEFVSLPDRIVSRYFSALYSADGIYLGDDDPLTPSERADIQAVLGLNVVHNPGQETTLTTSNDVQKRSLARRSVTIALEDADGVYNVGDSIRGTVTVSGADGYIRWAVVLRTGDRVVARDTTDPNGVFSFDLVASGAGDVTLSVETEIDMPGARFETRPRTASFLVRLLPAGQAMPIWSQRAWEALRVDGIVSGDPIARNRRISQLYAEMYNSNPDVFKWAGMAAHASYLVGDAMAEAEWWSRNAGAPPGAPDPKTAIRLLARGNLNVYDDMYRQMLAYRDGGGITAIRAMWANREIDQAQLDAWDDIAWGQQSGNQNFVWAGNERLLRFEQEVTLQNGAYAADPKFWYDLTNAWTPLGYLAEMPSPIPGDASVFQTFRTQYADVPDDASIGNFDARWAWIIRKQLPAYKTWSAANRTIDVRLLLNGGYKQR